MGFFDYLLNNDEEKAERKNKYNSQPDIAKVSEYNFEDGFLEEFAEDIDNINISHNHNEYTNNGVRVAQETDNSLTLIYDGILANNGASEVYTAVGYGDNNSWDNVNYYNMSKIGDKSFEVVLPITKKGNINLAFKDSANNWDNNTGKNYTFKH